MAQDVGYKKTVPQVIIELLKEKLPEGQFRGWYEGDPIIPKLSMLPAIIVSEPTTAFDVGPTGFDEIVHNITIQVVFNKKDEFGKPDNEATLESTIDHVVQGRDPVTGDFLDNTIMGNLRRNITLGHLVVENTGQLRKGVVPRSEQLMTVEGHIDLILTELQAIANRV